MDDPNSTQIREACSCQVGVADREPTLHRYLIVLHGPTPGAMVPLDPGDTLVGRGEDNDLILANPSVSRRHCGFRIDDEGRVWITDLRSTNGTFRNGQKLIPYEPTRLHDNDRLRLGTEIVLKYSCPAPEEEEFQRSMFERAARDPLTGLYNRAYFFEQLLDLARRAPTRGLGLGVLMIDVDHFKSINDTHGHDGGDVVLREVAARIRRYTRTDDLVARYGGEEFAVALPVSSSSTAFQRAERIRRGICATPILVAGDVAVKVTASIGLAFADRDSVRGTPNLLTAADRSLYRAKHAGRNRVDPGMPIGIEADATPITVDGL